MKFIISLVRGFVVPGRDHAPDDLHVSCPNFYRQVLKNTFGDTKVYSASLLSPAHAQAFPQSKASQKWLKPYRWASTRVLWMKKKKKKKQLCCSQAHHFLQQLHIRQVVSCSQHCVKHFASCSISWQLWTSNLTRDFSRALAFLNNAPIDSHLQPHNQDPEPAHWTDHGVCQQRGSAVCCQAKCRL